MLLCVQDLRKGFSALKFEQKKASISRIWMKLIIYQKHGAFTMRVTLTHNNIQSVNKQKNRNPSKLRNSENVLCFRGEMEWMEWGDDLWSTEKEWDSLRRCPFGSQLNNNISAYKAHLLLMHRKSDWFWNLNCNDSEDGKEDEMMWHTNWMTVNWLQYKPTKRTRWFQHLHVIAPAVFPGALWNSDVREQDGIPFQMRSTIHFSVSSWVQKETKKNSIYSTRIIH